MAVLILPGPDPASSSPMAGYGARCYGCGRPALCLIYVAPRRGTRRARLRGGRFVPLCGYHEKVRNAQMRCRRDAIVRAREREAAEALGRELAAREAANRPVLMFRLIAGPQWLTSRGTYDQDSPLSGEHAVPARASCASTPAAAPCGAASRRRGRT